MRKVKGMLCIDVDLDDDMTLSRCLAFLRSLYEFNYIRREVRVTEHGMHIYVDIPYPDDRDKATWLRLRYGDDPMRVEYDLGRDVVNVCFTSTELYVTKPTSVDAMVFNDPRAWHG